MGTTRTVGITAAAGTDLTQSLFAKLFTLSKRQWTLSTTTQNPLITLSCIVKVSRLLHPVGLGTLSQFPSGGSISQCPYRLSVWWAYTAFFASFFRHLKKASLPHQQPNRPQSHPKADMLQFTSRLGNRTFQYLLPIWNSPQFLKVIPVLRAGWLRVTQPFAVLPSERADLHGLIEFWKQYPPAGSTGVDPFFEHTN